MNEAQTRYAKIDPALKDAGWDADPFLLVMEQQVAPGRVEHDGQALGRRCLPVCDRGVEGRSAETGRHGESGRHRESGLVMRDSMFVRAISGQK